MKALRWGLLVLIATLGISATIKWWLDGTRIAHAQSLGWYNLPRDATSLLPDPLTTPDAVVAVLAAPTYGWRGYFATHPWIVYKRPDDTTYTRYEVIGWGSGNVVRRNHALPDSQWYGATPKLLVAYQGDKAASLIPSIETAITTYPFAHQYRSYPGPNSNTFLAHIGREVPALSLDLPPTAIGKDYRPWTSPLGASPSGRGMQVSIEGLLGAIVSPEEGIELNLLGLNMGFDLNCPALRLPFIGKLGFDGSLSANGCQRTGLENANGDS